MLLHRCPGMLRGSATAFCRPVARPATAPRSRPSPALCRPSLACSAGLGFSCSGFAGQSLRLPNRPGGGRPQGFRLLIQANGKRSMGATGGGTRRRRTRTSGFRARRLTPGGKKVLAARRKKGRHVLCPANSHGKGRK